jgi:hypothetical protein
MQGKQISSEKLKTPHTQAGRTEKKDVWKRHDASEEERIYLTTVPGGLYSIDYPLKLMKNRAFRRLGERSIEIRKTEIPEFEAHAVFQRSLQRAIRFRTKIGSQRNLRRIKNKAVALGPEQNPLEKSYFWRVP